MDMPAPQELTVDVNKIRKAAQSGIPLTITTYTLPHDIEVYVEQVMEAFLKEVGQERLKDYLIYCVRELAVNAKKANTKRVYFRERGLDLLNPEDYKIGMENFKNDTMEHISHYLQLQKEQGLYIKLIFQSKGSTINLEVRNNVAVTKAELIRIHDKLARSRQYESLEEALTQVLDDTEGAGLGLVILVLMLKKVGLDEDCFDIVSGENETIARISIPVAQARMENLSILSHAIVDEVSALPQFPENIVSIQKLINDPKSEMTDIARQISMDPAMTADLLKIVNSAQFMLAKKVDSISEAVKLVGIRGIKNLLYSYGTQKILGEDTAEKKILWEHSYRTAFYAYNLAKNFRKDRNLMDDVYVGGILHDMGKIVFSNVHPDLIGKIRSFCGEKGIPAATFEDLSAGMNHAEIGALIAEKWNFPENLVTAIRLHHDPTLAETAYRDLVETVYLANMLCEYEAGNVTFDQIEKKTLASFGITSEKQIESLLTRFSEGFTQESKRTR
jgi:putative nucleotidyltransferase with HDIG domain